ncbi:LysM peptidoglycan-binding domain-containing protein [Lacticaseibacillus brantae]|uniref:LysM domain-containing protein n=1 Tax=Lacticaseibacillus brantae DSM 23927 TaxID=1423727 RepID=A0A0R2AVX5_9LACO|nr:LysM peptidoglycan-binding domain-containing protein [Lacticaseibacillus brantae]KRM71601.1 hypothetical protein FC34_GL001255 [Lacticaseibacillus brantae DSM 23927]
MFIIKNQIKWAIVAVLALFPALASANQAVNAVTTADYQDYTVKSGDTLWDISQRNGITLSSLTAANHIDLNNYIILPGELLHIPAKIEFKVADNPIAEAQHKVAAQQAAQQKAKAAAQAAAQQAAAQAKAAAAAKAQQAQQAAQQAAAKPTTVSYGSSLKTYVLNKMVAATGESAATWDAIITRESGWQATAQNPGSTAHGLFQSLWINGSNDVDTQIADAIRLYNASGMSPWAL